MDRLKDHWDERETLTGPRNGGTLWESMVVQDVECEIGEAREAGKSTSSQGNEMMNTGRGQVVERRSG